MPDGCLFCEGERPMKWMITHLDPPVTIQSCEDDIANNLMGVLSEQLNVDYEWLYDLISNGVNALADAHAKAKAAEEAKAKLRRKAQEKAESAVLERDPHADDDQEYFEELVETEMEGIIGDAVEAD